MSDRFDDVDLYITDDGDLAINVLDDLATVSDIDYVVQSVTSRVRSVASDWFYDNIGADIETFIGQPNTKATADLLGDSISVSLRKDNFCTMDDLIVISTPVDSLTVLIGIFLNTQFQSEPLSFIVTMNFLTGFKVVRKT